MTWNKGDPTRVRLAHFVSLILFAFSLVNLPKQTQCARVETIFIPAPIPTWSSGGAFGSGTLDLGGLLVSQMATFNKVWSIQKGGQDNLGATFFDPITIPDGFAMLGCYTQPNNRYLFGMILLGKDNEAQSLVNPIDYSLVWSSESSPILQEAGPGYFWLPIAPEGYKALGHVVTNSSQKPPLNKVKCVKNEFTEEVTQGEWIWRDGNGFNVFELIPSNRGINAYGVRVGTFFGSTGTNSLSTVACLNNTKMNMSLMPNIQQVQELIKEYGPIIFSNPNEDYFPSTVNWFFSNGASLYASNGSSPIPIQPNGANLPQGGSNDGAYWIDLPLDDVGKERVKKGDPENVVAYIHIKPMFGGIFTDIAIWIFYPFNGPSRLKVEFFDIPLGRIGEHVGDWEHVALRIGNFYGNMWRVYFSKHSTGEWLYASELEYFNGRNKPIVYASKHGHASYPHAGKNIRGPSDKFGIRDDTDMSNTYIDTGVDYELVSAEYLGGVVVEPAWLNYCREWGPTLDFDVVEAINIVLEPWPKFIKKKVIKLLNSLPSEVFQEEGPTGPKMKENWNGDEVV